MYAYMYTHIITQVSSISHCFFVTHTISASCCYLSPLQPSTPLPLLPFIPLSPYDSDTKLVIRHCSPDRLIFDFFLPSSPAWGCSFAGYVLSRCAASSSSSRRSVLCRCRWLRWFRIHFCRRRFPCRFRRCPSQSSLKKIKLYMYVYIYVYYVDCVLCWHICMYISIYIYVCISPLQLHPPWSGPFLFSSGRVAFGCASGINGGEWKYHSPTRGRILQKSPKARRFAHMGGRNSDILYVYMRIYIYMYIYTHIYRCIGAFNLRHNTSYIHIYFRMYIYIYMWASGLWMGEWHQCGRVNFSLAHEWAFFRQIAQVTAIFAQLWAKFSQMGGLLFRGNFTRAILAHLQNRGRCWCVSYIYMHIYTYMHAYTHAYRRPRRLPTQDSWLPYLHHRIRQHSSVFMQASHQCNTHKKFNSGLILTFLWEMKVASQHIIYTYIYSYVYTYIHVGEWPLDGRVA